MEQKPQLQIPLRKAGKGQNFITIDYNCYNN